MADGWAVGIDLAWSPRNRTGVALAEITSEVVRIVQTDRLTTNDEIVAFVRQAGTPLTIAIDAPTILPNEQGQRPCERVLQQMFGRHNAGPYPSNRTLLGAMNHGIPRGCELSERLQRELGAVDGLFQPRHSEVSVLEVFPAPAIVRLFNLKKAIPYKQTSGRSPETCRAALRTYLNHLQGLSAPSLEMNELLTVRDERGVALKNLEDRADAALCAYIGAMAWLFGATRVEIIGDLQTGYVVVPAARPSTRGSRKSAPPITVDQIEAALEIRRLLPAWQDFDRTLKHLSERMPGFTLEETLVKIAAINSLYATNLYALHRMGRHVTKVLSETETVKAPELVEEIARLEPRAGGKSWRYHSFASKFCHFFVDREAFPILDTWAEDVVALHLGSLAEVDDDRRYVAFAANVQRLRREANLAVSTSHFDAYLWLRGAYEKWLKDRNRPMSVELKAFFRDNDGGSLLKRLRGTT